MFEQFKTGNPIWVYYIDIDSGANLVVPQLLRGRIGQLYKVPKKEFPHYRYVKTDGVLEGTFDLHQRSVKIFYRKKNWGEVQDVEMFLALDGPAVIYDTVKGMPVGQPLPQDITIKAFERVATKDGEFWYEIGPNQWIKYDKMHVVDDPFNPKNEKIGSRLAKRLTILPLHNIKATIDYIPGKAIDVYNAPYGETSGKISDGTAVKLTGKLSDNNEITWYQIGPDKYVSGNYIKITEDDE